MSIFTLEELRERLDLAHRAQEATKRVAEMVLQDIVLLRREEYERTKQEPQK